LGRIEVVKALLEHFDKKKRQINDKKKVSSTKKSKTKRRKNDSESEIEIDISEVEDDE
jgi:hypothetical protein